MNFQRLDRRLLTILLIVFVQMVGSAMIMPILPIYALTEFDMSPQFITLLGTAFFAAQFVAGPFLGRLSDKRGRVPILIASQIGTAISFLMLALAQSTGLLFVARVVDGITGGNIIVAQAYITDITPRERRTVALGYIFALFGLGFVIGPALGSVLAAAFGPRVPYIIAAAAATLTVVLTRLTLHETLTPEQRAANRMPRRSLRELAQGARLSTLALILLIAFLGQFGMGLLQSTFALYGEAVLFADLGEDLILLGIGLTLAAVGLSQFLTQAFLLRPLLERYSEARLVAAGNVLRTLGLALFAAIATAWIGVAAGVVLALGMGIMMPPLQSLSTTTVADEMRGAVLGIYQSSISLAIIISTAIAGVIFSVDPAMPFWLAAGLGVLAMMPALLLLRQAPAGRIETAPASSG